MATLVRWEPFRELTQLRGEMGGLLSGLYDNRTNQSWVPPLDVWETDTEVVYAFDLPGLEEERISIEVQDDTLTVSGERNGSFRERRPLLPLRAPVRVILPGRRSTAGRGRDQDQRGVLQWGA